MTGADITATAKINSFACAGFTAAGKLKGVRLLFF
jgi:hypothetical protein